MYHILQIVNVLIGAENVILSQNFRLLYGKPVNHCARYELEFIRILSWAQSASQVMNKVESLC